VEWRGVWVWGSVGRVEGRIWAWPLRWVGTGKRGFLGFGCLSCCWCFDFRLLYYYAILGQGGIFPELTWPVCLLHEDHRDKLIMSVTESILVHGNVWRIRVYYYVDLERFVG
jgi:hypothetical protein